MAASQRRLARYAPATALAMTMHSYWVGIAVEMERAGDTSLRWVLEAALAGEVFAAGHAETGNDIPVLLSTCAAERVEGGSRLTGRKQRSEEHTSELQSLMRISYAVFFLRKKTIKIPK